KDAKNPGTLFMETVNASYSTFQTTLGAKSWFIGIRKNGKPKPGKRTGEAQKDTRFLLRKLMTDHHELRMSHDDRPLANRVRLCCNGYNLAIRSNGEILGSDDVSDPDSEYKFNRKIINECHSLNNRLAFNIIVNFTPLKDLILFFKQS
uniref:Uncharacterized protein LOC114341462 n=1 Tax=Diabrotica virgifera virgifera TaxID=50390 RepID=A0A6P7GER5_DIAVI